MKLPYSLHRFFWKAIDLLYPPQCAGCNAPGARWCSDCQQTTPKFSKNVCVYCQRRCGENNPCLNCEGVFKGLDEVWVWGLHHGPLRHALHRLKYRRDLGLGEVLADHLVELAKEKNLVDFLVLPVPLGKQRLRERGYNQASLLAQPLAMRLDFPYIPKALRRVRDTRTQVGLSLEERRKNVLGAFEADAFKINGAKVLVVDDVLTTGATINAAGKALKDAGARYVVGLTMARAP